MRTFQPMTSTKSSTTFHHSDSKFWTFLSILESVSQILRKHLPSGVSISHLKLVSKAYYFLNFYCVLRELLSYILINFYGNKLIHRCLIKTNLVTRGKNPESQAGVKVQRVRQRSRSKETGRGQETESQTGIIVV